MDKKQETSPVDISEREELVPSNGCSKFPNIVSEIKTLTMYAPFKRDRMYKSNRKKNERIVSKTGEINVAKTNKLLCMIPNYFTALVKARWRWTLVHFFLVFSSIWLIFGGIWWFIAYAHGDFEETNLPPFQNMTGWVPCVTKIYGFTSAFLFSIEIHTTIGYGSRTLTLECPSAMFAMCIQSIIGLIIQSLMIGIVFAKLTRPKNRTHTLLFSNIAVVNLRDGKLCLIFRVGDVRKSRIIDVSIYAYLIRFRTKKGDILHNKQIKLKLRTDGCEDDIQFMWPISVIHIIDDGSPLLKLSAMDLLRCKLEVLVVLEGTIESTGQLVQARSSYTTKEILWGHRFEPMFSYNRDRQGYEVNYARFDETMPVDTPFYSAEVLYRKKREKDILKARS